MITLAFLKMLWNAILILGGSFLLYFIVTYPFQRRWLTARIRKDDWLKGNFFRHEKISPPGFTPVGNAVGEIAGSLEKLIENYRKTGGNPALKILRKDARGIVISISESVTAILDHWKTLGGMDLVQEELEERARQDAGNLMRLHANLQDFRTSFQKAAVSQTTEALTEAADRVLEVSHFTRLMSESIEDGQVLESD